MISDDVIEDEAPLTRISTHYSLLSQRPPGYSYLETQTSKQILCCQYSIVSSDNSVSQFKNLLSFCYLHPSPTVGSAARTYDRYRCRRQMRGDCARIAPKLLTDNILMRPNVIAL